MIDREAIGQIIAQYKKHGWALRRVLMSDEFASSVQDAASLFDDAEVQASDLDAAWFSRSSRPGMTAWELRYLGQMPYALVEGIPDDLSPAEAEARLREVEVRMKEVVKSAHSGH